MQPAPHGNDRKKAKSGYQRLKRKLLAWLVQAGRPCSLEEAYAHCGCTSPNAARIRREVDHALTRLIDSGRASQIGNAYAAVAFKDAPAEDDPEDDDDAIEDPLEETEPPAIVMAAGSREDIPRLAESDGKDGEEPPAAALSARTSGKSRIGADSWIITELSRHDTMSESGLIEALKPHGFTSADIRRKIEALARSHTLIPQPDGRWKLAGRSAPVTETTPPEPSAPVAAAGEDEANAAPDPGMETDAIAEQETDGPPAVPDGEIAETQPVTGTDAAAEAASPPRAKRGALREFLLRTLEGIGAETPVGELARRALEAGVTESANSVGVVIAQMARAELVTCRKRGVYAPLSLAKTGPETPAAVEVAASGEAPVGTVPPTDKTSRKRGRPRKIKDLRHYLRMQLLEWGEIPEDTIIGWALEANAATDASEVVTELRAMTDDGLVTKKRGAYAPVDVPAGTVRKKPDRAARPPAKPKKAARKRDPRRSKAPKPRASSPKPVHPRFATMAKGLEAQASDAERAIAKLEKKRDRLRARQAADRAALDETERALDALRVETARLRGTARAAETVGRILP